MTLRDILRFKATVMVCGVLFLAMGMALATTPAKADAMVDCRAGSSAERRLSSCTAIIDGSSFTADQKAIAYRNRGRVRVEAGALDMAMADLGQAIRLNGADSQAYLYRAQVKISLADTAGAIADFSEAIRLKPASAIGFSGRGHAQLVRGDHASAIADFSEAIRLNPKSASARNNRGLAYKAAGDAVRAVDDFTAAVVQNPIYGLAYNNRGYAHEGAGRKIEAIADYRSALLVDPSLTGAKDGLKRLGAAGELASESAALVQAGKALVEQHCQGCHAVGAEGLSPNPKAPTFRSLHRRHPMQALREPLTRGIAAPHDEMPKFRLGDADIDKVVAYINNLGAAAR